MGYLSFRILLVSFLFVSIVITNMYKSIVTNDLTAPIQRRQLTGFSDVIQGKLVTVYGL
jgi:hypothetical protein